MYNLFSGDYVTSTLHWFHYTKQAGNWIEFETPRSFGDQRTSTCLPRGHHGWGVIIRIASGSCLRRRASNRSSVLTAFLDMCTVSITCMLMYRLYGWSVWNWWDRYCTLSEYRKMRERVYGLCNFIKDKARKMQGPTPLEGYCWNWSLLSTTQSMREVPTV